MNENNCAPIVAFVYSRPDKARKMFGSLKRCQLAKESDLYIFSDGPKDARAEIGVKETREYLDELSSDKSFKSITIVKADHNKGLAASVISGVTEVIEKYDRVIAVEDDLIFSELFLVYMNKCLDFYRDDERIWSISGYTPKLKTADEYDKDIYLNYRASSWGWGTWKDRWQMVDWDVKDYASFRFNLPANMYFCRGGNDLPSMLRAQMKGKIDSWAVRWCYSQSRHHMYSVAPRVSLVSNEGLDGSGTNSKPEDTNKLGNEELDINGAQWCYPHPITDRRMIRDFYRKYHINVWIRISDKVREIHNRKIKI